MCKLPFPPIFVKTIFHSNFKSYLYLVQLQGGVSRNLAT